MEFKQNIFKFIEQQRTSENVMFLRRDMNTHQGNIDENSKDFALKAQFNINERQKL